MARQRRDDPAARNKRLRHRAVTRSALLVRPRFPSRWRAPACSFSRRIVWATLGTALVAVAASATANWAVGFTAASGETVSVATVNISSSSLTPSAHLYPGGTGDVRVSISNPNPFPVTITAFLLPTDTTYASGYTTSALTTARAGCSAGTPSHVIWHDSTDTAGSPHALTAPITVAASGQVGDPLMVTLTDAARMTMGAPAACQNTFFEMPPLVGVEAMRGTAATTTPAIDGWTS